MWNIDWVNFHWVGFIFWLLIGISFLLLIIGLIKKSWGLLIISGITLLLPSLYFAGAINYFKLFVLTPLIPFIFAFIYLIKKKKKDIV